MSDRVCVIHVGTHKTGTTGQQRFLALNKDALYRHGILYACTGWYQNMPGNHQLAWELLEDSGTAYLGMLVEELLVFPAETAILSSEDFSLLYRHPARLERLARALRTIGYTPKILIYLRAQPPYAESQYIERVKQQTIVPVSSYVNEILRTGKYDLPGSALSLEFSYDRLLAPFVDVFGLENVMVRVYSSQQEPRYIYRDLFCALGELSPYFKIQDVDMQVDSLHENPSISFAQLLLRAHLALRPESRLKDPELFLQAFAPEVPLEMMAGRATLLSRTEWLALLERFASSNRSLTDRYGISLPFLSERDVPGAEDERWERTAQLRDVFDRSIDMWLRRTNEFQRRLE